MKRDWINRLILPGLAFKAVVIGGGYATGRELVEFFLPSGPVGGLWAMLLAGAMWSALCALTFVFAFVTRSSQYRDLFGHLLHRFAFLFEVLLILFTMLTLSVFGAAAGAIGAVLFGWVPLAGTLMLAFTILIVTARGNIWVEALFKYVSILLYGTYAVFLLLCLSHFGGKIGAAFADSAPTTGWITGGITYASYNVIGAALILPALRHQRSVRDAFWSGLLCGPLAMTPAIIFFVCLSAYAPQVIHQQLPSDFLLQRLDMPLFHIAFQVMIFAALLECSVGNVHAINERVMARHLRRGGDPAPQLRLAITLLLLVFSMGVAQQVGLIVLIAQGYRLLAYLVLAVFILPLVTLGTWRLMSVRAHRDREPGSMP